MDNDASNSEATNLKGHLLIAMPGMGDPRFARAVILICSHDEDRSMGFILNQRAVSPTLRDVLEELGLKQQVRKLDADERDIALFRGGPVEKGRGFVIHTLDFSSSATAKITDTSGLTATIDVLKKISSDKPPEKYRMLLGYGGWSAGQLEQEIAENAWLSVQATEELIFDTEPALAYDAALAELGVSEATLSASAGHA